MSPIKVPEYQRTEKLVTPRQESPTMPRIIPEAFGTPQAEAAQRMAAAGERLAGVLSQHILKRKQDQQDKEVLGLETSFRQDFQNRLLNPETEMVTIGDKQVERPKGLLQRKLGQTSGLTIDLDNQYRTVKEQYSKNLSPYQLSKLGPAMDNYYTNQRDNVIKHEAQELDLDFKNTTESNVAQKTLDAAIIKDPGQLAFAIDDAIASALPFNKRFDEVTRKLKEEKIAVDIAKSAIVSTMETTGNYVVANAMLEGIKGKVSPATFATLSDEVGTRSVDIAIAKDLSTQQEESPVMSELLKGKKGSFSFLSTTKLNEAIKDSQQKIYYNGQIAKRASEEIRNKRYEGLTTKVLNREATLNDIRDEMNIPEEAGGIKKSTLLTYQNAMQRGIKDNLTQMLKEETADNEPTKRARLVKQYVDIINRSTSTETERWDHRDKLAKAWADGAIDDNEKKFLDELKAGSKDPNNIFAKVARLSINGLQASLAALSAPQELIAVYVKELVSKMDKNKSVSPDEVKEMTKRYIHDQLPEAATVGPAGGYFRDFNNNQFRVTEEGIEQGGPEPTTKENGTNKPK